MPQAGASPLPSGTEEAKTDSFLASLLEPQCGQGVPSQFEERISTSLSSPHLAQWNS